MGFFFCQVLYHLWLYIYYVIYIYVIYNIYTHIYIYCQIYISINSLFREIVLGSRSHGKSETEKDSNLYLVVQQNFPQAEVWGKSVQSDP